ncbi:hypothetical protein [Nodularia chucula]|uniref:hypothetical protein n=1 Tax=Nodularia chucula TaxID=3093667 RepID=UPI0039C74745
MNSFTIPGESTDFRKTDISDPNINRLAFISDLYYDRQSNLYYGVGDRGPGGGIISYDTRVQKFSLDVDPNTGLLELVVKNYKALLQLHKFPNQQLVQD